jgi:hypothetical protein
LAVANTNSQWAHISINGSPAEVAASFEQFRQAGLEYAICLFESEDLDDYLRQIQVFAEEIAPQFDRAD